MKPSFGDRLRVHDGPRTRELSRVPAGFGLGTLPATAVPDATTQMTCGYCSTGCSLTLHLRHGEAIGLTPTAGHPVNRGMACPKGWESLAPMEAADRATTPMVRTRGGKLKAVDWPTALRLFTENFKSVQAEHGPASVAFLSTGQITTEEMALLGALTRFGMGIEHGDGSTRQCMATAVEAYKHAFGFDAPPFTYADLEISDVIVLIGSNLAISHPIMWERVMANPNNPEIIVVDPRRTETAVASTHHYAIHPKSDLALLYGVARRLIELGAVDEDYVGAHTNGFADMERFLSSYPLTRAASEAGLPVERVDELAHLIAEGRRVSFWWTMGVNQSHQGVRTAQAIINLALMTGNMGRPGTGANSITGQCNAMGSRLYSNTTNLLGGHDFADPEARAKVTATLGISDDVIPRNPSWAYDQIMAGISSGDIRGLWVIATNTSHSWINQTECRDVLDRLDYLVVQDLYADTETAHQADLVLPAAGWAEKDGTFINSERRITVVKKVRRAPGHALADFTIFKMVADAWGCGDMFEKWSSPEATFDLLGQLSRGQPCDMSGISSYRLLDDLDGIQWPAPAGSPMKRGAERRLFADGRFFTPDGRARFLYEATRAPPEQPSIEFPMILLTGRGSASQWHTQTRTSRSGVLRMLHPERPYVEMAPVDAEALGIAPMSEVVIESARGSMRAVAHVVPSLGRGQVFVPMHYPDTNRLTHPGFDPYSRQPSYKHCAVRVRLPQPWE